jgi:hypothetical protein
MEFTDKDLQCDTCGAEFVFSAREQQFFQGHGFTNLPRHCNHARPNVPGAGEDDPKHM